MLRRSLFLAAALLSGLLPASAGWFPLGAPSDIVEGALFVSPSGSGNACTEVAPCALANAGTGASGTIVPGSTVYLRGGNYNSVTGYIISVDGAVGQRITFQAYPGETPIVDGSYTEFRTVGNSAWEVFGTHTTNNHVYRSINAFSTSGSEAGGFMEFDFEGETEVRALVKHKHSVLGVATTDYITADEQNAVPATQPPRYMGYGFLHLPITLGGDNKFYIRLDKPLAEAMLDRPTPDLSSTDPRDHDIRMFPGTEDGVEITGDYITFGEGIKVQNYRTTVKISGANCILYKVDLRFGMFGVEYYSDNNLLVDGVTVDGRLVIEGSWLAWQDVKGGETPADHMRKCAFNVGSGIRITNSTIRYTFDGILSSGGRNDHEIDHNFFDGVWDDAYQIEQAQYQINMHHNLIIGAGPSHDNTGTASPNPDPATIFWHDDVVDATVYSIFWGRNGRLDDAGESPATVSPTHGEPVGYSAPWKKYNLTIISPPLPPMDSPPNSFVQIDYFGHQSTTQQGIDEAYNNIFILDRAMGRNMDSASGTQKMDANVYWRPLGIRNLWRFIDTSTGVIDADVTPLQTLAQMRATQAYTDSLGYSAGWETNGIEADPQLDANYVPQNAAVLTGAVDLTATGWPDAVISGFAGVRGARGPVGPLP